MQVSLDWNSVGQIERIGLEILWISGFHNSIIISYFIEFSSIIFQSLDLWKSEITQENNYHEDSLNLYSYCRNNSITYIDPSGNICEAAAEGMRVKVEAG